MPGIPSLRFLLSRIDRAETYLRDHDIVGASALAGAVLEATLRRLAEQNRINKPATKQCPECGRATGSEFTLGSLVQALSARHVLEPRGAAVLLRVTRIRNTAAHGHFGAIPASECSLLIETTKSLVAWIRTQERASRGIR